MANQSKLKAWVRYDGTGRVISGGPIFQVNKPKVGNWKQIDANLCCNGALTTTTTTTSGGGGGAPTAWVVSTGGQDVQSTCNNVGGTQIIYTAGSTLTDATIYTNAGLTTVNAYLWFAYGGVVYQTNNLGVASFVGTCLSTTTSTTTQGVNSASFRQSPNSNFVCAQPPSITLNWVGELTNGTQIFYDQALTQPYYDTGFIANVSTNAIFQTSNGYAFNFGFC